MGWFRTLLRWSEAPSSASTSDAVTLEAPPPRARFGVDVPSQILEAATGGGAIAARVSRDEALQVPAVLRARNLIAGTLSTLPMRFHDRDRRQATPTTLLEQIDPDVPNSVTMAATYEDLLFESVSWWRVTRFGWHGYPVEAQHVPIDSVHVSGTGRLPSQMLISPDVPYPSDGQVFIDGIPVDDREVIRFDSPNPPLLVHAARAIRTALRLDRTASSYADEPTPQGLLLPEDGTEPLDDGEVDDLMDRWSTARRNRTWAYLQGVKAQTLQWSPEQLQLADARQHAVLEIARATGVDPEDLGVSTTSRTYANAESRRLALLDFTLGAYVTAVQERLSMRDVLPRGYYAKVDFAGFLRSDARTRMETYEVGLRVGAYTHDEIRELEDKPLLTGDERAEIERQRATAPPAEEDNEMPPTMHFGAGTAQVSFDAAETVSTFRVNTEKRTISGLVVPWGKVANNGEAKWRFADESLHWVDETRTKLNLNHDSTQAIGYAVRLQNTSAGLDATFKIADVPEGDRALKLAEGKVFDGFSIEVDLEDGWENDPSDRSVRLVQRAKLRGVALTAMPAFDDARVSAVAASLDKRKDTGMGGEVTAEAGKTEQFDFAGYMKGLGDQITESHKNLTTELAGSIGESVSEGVKAALEQLPAPQDGPQGVRAARYTVGREAPVYSFNGFGNSLVRDAWYAAREQDSDATERLRKYRAQMDEMSKLAAANFAPQSTTSASQIIPPGYRPDLYVPELTRGRPLVGLCSRGMISNATPFLVPTFGSVTGATADHVEGTNPADGSLTFGEVTVTPGAISGRLTLTREIVDSSNPAIDQIALAAMRESYNQQTEAKVYTEINGKATTTTTYAAASVITDVRDLLAQYPFVRFAAPTGAAMNQKVTRAFATTNGSDGRPLLPSVGAENTSGLGNAVNQGWFIDGLTFVPAWSIGDALTNDVVLIVNRSDVWVWESPLLSFRFEEKQGPANIEMNVFGYFATRVLRASGIFAIRNP
ncbi:HK97 family phage prohead protease [Saccharomonospora amisosensis]|uniref:HK97 family phage prohead protease n=1 Tax=Saccharomonospora amisosensis TaxID=1128677 RepID=A0A7X5UMB4_9PSEU|nr:phage major capsid protein [Saccharomonospora amisosensis]NIJ10620.1 HK97 family phage prohead protease [Saccharomonospora amisosensis]